MPVLTSADAGALMFDLCAELGSLGEARVQLFSQSRLMGVSSRHPVCCLSIILLGTSLVDSGHVVHCNSGRPRNPTLRTLN